MSSKDDEVTITLEEYQHLLKRDEQLSALEQGGVDNWEWYSQSLQDYIELNELTIDYWDE